MTDAVDTRHGLDQDAVDELVAILRDDKTVADVATVAARVLREAEGLELEGTVDGLIKAAQTHPVEVADAVAAAAMALAMVEIFGEF